MEIWDIYDKNMIKTEKTHIRGEEMPKGCYHLTVDVIPFSSDGEILIQKRADTVRVKPGMWSMTTGSAISGETFFDAMRRELSEELGLTADENNSSLLMIYRGNKSFCGVFTVRTDKNAVITIQKEEVSEAKWVSRSEIENMIRNGIFNISFNYIERLFEKIAEDTEKETDK